MLFNRLVEDVKEWARGIVEEENGQVPMMLYLLRDGKVARVAPHIPKEARPFVKEVLQSFLSVMHPQAYVFVHEAWMTTSRRALDEGIRVSDLPFDDRQDVILLIGVERGKDPTGATCVLELRGDSRRLGEWKPAEQPTGRFVVPDW